MNNYFQNPLYRKAFFEDTSRIMAGFQNDYSLLKPGANKKDTVKNIHRYAHSLKGLLAMMEIKEGEQIAASLESAVGQVLKDELAELDEIMLGDLKNGFAKIKAMLRQIQDDLNPPASGMDAPA